MKNKDDYEKKAAAKGKLTIAGLGENVIYIGGNKFSGLEMLNQTEGGIRENLRQIYERDTGETLDPEEAITAIRWTERARIQIIPFQSP
jgi:hypothetical protein